MQNNEDVVVMFRLQPDTSKRDVNVDIKPSSIEVRLNASYTNPSLFSQDNRNSIPNDL